MGAWIETPTLRSIRHVPGRRPSRGGVDRNCAVEIASLLTAKSPLAWGRGSKHCRPDYSRGGREVAPRVGAWIETLGKVHKRRHDIVAPRVGAWIETIQGRDEGATLESRPSRGAVDRNDFGCMRQYRDGTSPLAWGRGSKLLMPGEMQMLTEGRPSRGGVDRNKQARGLSYAAELSPLAWGRGSKPVREDGPATVRRRPSRGGVDRNYNGGSAAIATLLGPNGPNVHI